jgi:hypothetical protein
MSPSAEALFPPRGERGQDVAGVETFPWPVIGGAAGRPGERREPEPSFPLSSLFTNGTDVRR